MSGNGIIISGNGGDTKPPRKFPPLCWSQEEALVLIQAYRDRWHALRRGCLRTADWDAVAEDVGRICPGATPPKTSAHYVTQVEDNDNDEDNDEEFEDGYYETPINKNLERGSGYGERNGRSFAGYGESEKRGVKRSNDDDDDDDDDDDNDNDVDDDPLGKLVSSIKVLADGFVKMEKMKMDMVREIETMRMEAEMKRNEMLLESQRQMIAAFVKGLAENKK
nr:hypothetical protein [Tanacetum cinerariifolium]